MGQSGKFTWGTATSAYQIEGGRREDGKGDSIWDRFSDMGRLRDPGDDGCDHYRLWADDVGLMAELGVDAYRFSIAWTRIVPDGDGEVNQVGLDFYRRLLEELLENGIQPYPTLYHWDLPQALQQRGGWANRATVDAFVRYSSIVAENFGDRVRHWITHNEPWVASMLGHQTGQFAPGVSDWSTALRAGHHILLSHGRALLELRASTTRSEVGIALDCRPATPASNRAEDIAATKHFDGFRNRWFFDPVFGRGYPEDMIRTYVDKGRLPEGLESFVRRSDMDVIAQPLDFLGINYYTTTDISKGLEESEEPELDPGPEAPVGHTEMGWRIDPAGLTEFLQRVEDTYQPRSILITENGASYSDAPDESGRVNDQRRIDYISRHIVAIADARDSGVPVDGYFVWSLLDNLEWTHGFSQRFGLVYVDHVTQLRTPKNSYYWYQSVVAHDTPEDVRAQHSTGS